MPAPPLLAKMPRPALFALAGAIAGLFAALTAGELVWALLAPSPPAEQHTEPPPAPATQPPPPAPAPPSPQLAVTAAPVTVYPGARNAFGVRVARDRFDGPVAVRFDAPAGSGLSAAEISIPAGSATARAEVVAAPDAKPGTFAITVTATATADDKPVSATASVEVTLAALPPPPARLAVSVSPLVQAYQKGKNTFAVRVARADFDDAITVTFEGAPDGVKIPTLSIPAGAAEATAELTVDATAKTGSTKVTATARSAPKGVATSATAAITADVLDPSRAPLDIVVALDCTGTMGKYTDGLNRGFLKLADELDKARFDVRFGVVGFRDTTLGQPLELPRIGGERMSGDAARFAAVIRGLRLGGGGGDGESSLDGVAEAADFPLRASATRVVLLVTDGGPKRSDWRMKSADMTVKHLRAKRIDQLHVVALPEFRKPFEPLWQGAPGKYFDLKTATVAAEFGAVVADLSKAITETIPPRPEPKTEPSGPAPVPVLPAPMPGKAPTPPASRAPDEPQIAALAPPAPSAPSAPEPTPEAPAPAPGAAPAASARSPLALGAWAIVVACLATAALFFSQRTFFPGERPSVEIAAAGYGGGVVVGLLAGALGYVAFDAAGVGLLTRLGGACFFGLGVGLTVPLAELLLLRTDVPAPAPAPPASAPTAVPLPTAAGAPPVPSPPLLPPPPPVRAPLLDLDLPTVEAYPSRPPSPLPPPPPAREPLPELDLPTIEAYPSSPPPPVRAPLLDLDLPPVEAYTPAAAKLPVPPPAPPPPPAVVPHKPSISGAPKPGDGCPKCGRKIPGPVGKRYCMLCDNTF